MDLTAHAAERLQQADACHDDDPPRAAALLREVVPALLDAGQRPRYAFLVNHLLAEKLGRPGEAWQFQQALLAAAGAQASLPLLRHGAAAARLAGDTLGQARLNQRLADSAGVPLAQATEFTALAAASFQVPMLPADAAGEATLAALLPLAGEAWQRPSPLDGATAVMTNNLASDLLERPVAELSSPPLRAAMLRAAELSQAFWHRAGQWVNHERAHYLRAMVANALGDPAQAELQARAGLVLLTSFDHGKQETVDQAFLLSELAHALARQGRRAESEVERAQADALAEAFDDPELDKWYQGRLARQAALDTASAAA
ncbi:MAG: hypothetical protein ACOZJX_03460 [Pseudomonadota bacterium]